MEEKQDGRETRRKINIWKRNKMERETRWSRKKKKEKQYRRDPRWKRNKWKINKMKEKKRQKRNKMEKKQARRYCTIKSKED